MCDPKGLHCKYILTAGKIIKKTKNGEIRTCTADYFFFISFDFCGFFSG